MDEHNTVTNSTQIVENQVELTDALLKAMNKVIEQKQLDSKSTSVIEGRVDTVIDGAQGLYRIEYLGGFFNAYSSNRNYIYNVDDKVYIMIPDGDMEKTKIILALISSPGTKINLDSQDTFYLPYGDNLLFLDYTAEHPYTLSTFLDEPLPDGSANKFTLNSQAIIDAMNTALRYTKTFNFTFQVKTDIDTYRRINGNYGLYIKIPIIQDNFEKDIEITLDTHKMIGNVYGFNEYSVQNCYFTIPDNCSIDENKLIELKAFVVGFPKEEGHELTPDIKLKDISLSPVKVLSYADKSGYNLILSATSGAYFSDSVAKLDSEKDLIPNLYYDGNIVDFSTMENDGYYKIYWFIQDFSINTDSDHYHRLGGVGWRFLNEKKANPDPADEDPYITNVYKYHIYQKDVRYELRYKVVVMIDDGQTLSSDILIKNLSSTVQLNLKTSKGTTDYVENIGDVNLIMDYYDKGITDVEEDIEHYPHWEYSFYWQRYDRSGVQAQFNPTVEPTEKTEDGYAHGKIAFPVTLIDKLNTFNCTVILKRIEISDEPIDDPDHPGSQIYPKVITEFVIGSRSIAIKTSTEISLGIELENGAPFFKYDWSGNSPLVANYDGTAISKENVLRPIKIARVTDENGIEYTDTELETLDVAWYVPSTTENNDNASRTMIIIPSSEKGYYKNETFKGKKYYVRRGTFKDLRTFNYTIKDLFDNNMGGMSGDNTVILEVGMKDKTVIKYIDFTFTKDGMSGTNGSNYAGVITYQGFAYGATDPDTGLPHKCQLVYIAEFESQEKGGEPWFLYNPAWVGSDTYTGNVLGLIHISDSENSVTIEYQSPTEEDPQHKATATIKSWASDPDKKLFEVDIYCNGEKIRFGDNNSKDAVWSIFDSSYDYEGIMTPIGVRSTGGAQYPTETNGNGLISILEKPPISKWGGITDPTWHDVWFYEDVSTEGERSAATICATLQVKAKAKVQALSNPDISNDPTNSPMYVYTYYPIEVTYISNGESIYNYIPTLTGGFDDIIFSSSGLNPQYDNSKPFQIYGIEGLDEINAQLLKDNGYNFGSKSLCEYKWAHSSNLSCAQSLKSRVNESTIKIDAAPKLNNEYTKNYVKVQVDFNDSLKTEMTQAKEKADQATEIANSLIVSYNKILDNKSIFDDFAGDITKPYDFIKQEISNNVSLLNGTKELEDQLHKIIISYQSLLNTLNKYQSKVKPDFAEAYQNLRNTVINTTNGYLPCAETELSLVSSVKQLNPNAVSDIISHIQNLQPNNNRLPNQRYVFTDSEKNNANYLFSFRSQKGNEFLNEIAEKFNSHEALMSGLGYAQTYNTLINEGLIILQQISLSFEEIRNRLKLYIEDHRWEEIIDFDSLDNKDLEDKKISFYKLHETLVAYYQQIRLNNDIDNPYAIISEVINKMNHELEPFKNFTLSATLMALYAAAKASTAISDKMQKIYNLVLESEANHKIIHAKPIIMLANRYELGFLNDWDGNKLKIDNDGGYVIAPQFGAGRKEEDNSFTGMVMGIYKKNTNDKTQRIGIFGKNHGEETLFLDAQTGAAVFGLRGEGQIYIDPRPQCGGSIFSGNYYSKYNEDTGEPDRSAKSGRGMLINLKDSYIHFGAGGGAFFYSGSHETHTSEEPGFRLDAQGISIGKGMRVYETGEFYLGYGTESSPAGKRKYIHFNPNYNNGEGRFKIGEDVILTATSISTTALQGLDIIIKNGGKIHDENNKFMISENGININSGTINMNQGSINLANNFIVNSNGSLVAKTADISGRLTAGERSIIGNWKITKTGRLYGYETLTDDNKDTIRLNPDSGTLGFYTGGTWTDKQGNPKRDFAYIGRISGDTNALGFFANLGKDEETGQSGGAGKCSVYANAFVSNGCAMRTNYIYVGCSSDSDGISKHSGARLGANGVIQTVKYNSSTKVYYWG